MLTSDERAYYYTHLESLDPDALLDSMLISAERLGFQILPYVQGGIRHHTAHGVEHSKKVMEYLNELVAIALAEGSTFNKRELVLLYSASWLHDIGNLRNREDHAAESCRMLRLLESRIQFGPAIGLLEEVITCHDSNTDLSEIPPVLEFEGEPVKVQFLAALFRLADACHMGEDRAFETMYTLLFDELLPVDHRHWQAHKAVLSVELNSEEKSIKIFVSNKETAGVLTEHFQEEFEKVRPFLTPRIPLDRVEIIEAAATDIDAEYGPGR